ncbi:hypothetical protein M085_4195, partial [Bacteroides fragilis str. 3986 N(B)19]
MIGNNTRASYHAKRRLITVLKYTKLMPFGSTMK